MNESSTEETGETLETEIMIHSTRAAAVADPEHSNAGVPALDLQPAGQSLSTVTDEAGAALLVDAAVESIEAPPARPKRSRSGSSSSNRPKKLRNLNAEEAFELLSQARHADMVHLYLRDGRVIEGAILFNEIKGTGRIINVIREISVDFRAFDVRDIRF